MKTKFILKIMIKANMEVMEVEPVGIHQVFALTLKAV